MHNKNIRVHSDEVTKATYNALERRHVTIEDIAESCLRCSHHIMKV